MVKKSIYIFNSGTLSRKDDTLLFEGEEGKRYIPVNGIESVHIFGEVNINKRLLEFLCKQQIVLHFYNYYDYYIGSFYPREHLNSGFVILQQCKAYLEDESRILLARSFIQGAARNILQVLKYYQRRKENLSEEIAQIEELMPKLEEQDSVERVMAIEGNIRQIYYGCFNSILEDDDYLFEARTKRPPKDRINSLISFGNSMLYTTVLSQIYQTQLDPRIGYLHSTNDRRFSLNLDLAEIFKPIIVDRTIFSLINKKILTKKDFQKELEGIILKDEGRMKFIKEFNDKLDTTIQHPGLNLRVSYKKLIRMEAYKLQKHITEGELYEPFVAKW